jgi:nucleotide-binding universal stress UspA family protein
MWPLFTHNLGPVQGIEGSGLRHAAEEILSEGVALAHEVSPELKVETDLKAGLPAEVLLEESEVADLLVVGSRGIGGLLGQLVGSVSLDLSGSSTRPLLVARYPWKGGRPVMACVEGGPDGQASSPSVLAEAAKLAGFLGEPLHIAHAVPPDRRHQHESPEEGRQILDRAAEEAARLAPRLTVTTALLEGRGVAKDLISEAAKAEVVVLGGHRPGGSPGAVATAVLKHAPCNVMVAR